MIMLEIAYVAGIIDGEGCIGFSYKKNKTGHERLTLIIQVDMTCHEVPEALRTQFGGTIFLINSKDEKHKSHSCWKIYQDEAGEFLKLILPYLIVKKRQAELALAYLKYKPTSTTPDLLYWFKNTMHTYNKRGV